jgi:tetratricopeptide (TPR) repeat protein
MLVSGLMILACVLACASTLRPWVAQWAGRGTPLDRAARTAISINPGNDRFQVILANLYQYSLFLRDYPAALTSYQSALRANPLDSTSWLHLAKLYQKLDRPLEADRALRLAVQLAPSNSSIMWETTLAYLEAGQLPEALRTLTRFISMSRDDTDRAKGYDLARRLVPPEEVFERVIPQDVTNYAQYLKYLLDRNQTDEALRVWGRLKEMHPAGYEPTDPTLKRRLAELLTARPGSTKSP